MSNFSAEKNPKKCLIFDSVFSQVDSIFSKYNTPHDFLRVFKNCLQNLFSSTRANFRGEASDAPPPTESTCQRLGSQE